MNVKWYRDDALLQDQTYDVDSSSYFCDTQVQAYNKIVITIGNMTKPNRFLKIFNIADGVVRQFYNDELQNVEIIEAITSNNQALNINESDLTILPKNKTGVLFQRTLPFSIYRDNELYGKFYIDTSTSNTDKTLYQIKVSDEIKLLEAQTYLGGIYNNVTVATLVAEILGDIDYELDETIGAYTISGYLPILNKREALREIAFAVNAHVDTSREDKVVIEPFSNTRDRYIGDSELFYVETTQQNIVTEIDLNTSQLTTTNATEDEIFNGELDGTQYIVFDSPKFNLTITGGTIDSSNCNYAIISGTGSTVVLKGKTYEIYTEKRTKTNEYTVSTDIENIEEYETTLTCNDIDILDDLKFVEYTLKARFKMDDTKVSDNVVLDHKTCRVNQLSYDLKQTEIIAEAELEKYYYDSTELYITTEDGVDLTTENNIILEAEE